MPRVSKKEVLGRLQRYRARGKPLGMKRLNIWVPDPSTPGFREEARRQAAILRGAPEEADALAFIEAAADFDFERP